MAINNALNASVSVNGVLISDNAGVISWLPNGTATQVLTANTGAPPSWENASSGSASLNLGIKLTGAAPQTLTVTSADGSALSGGNPATILLQNKNTPGQVVTFTVTADQSFTDTSAGDISGMRFGVTTGVDWAVDCPFYIYAVSNDASDTIAFMISRLPGVNVSPVAGSIGKAGAIVNTGESDFFSLASITVADYDQNPCICLGSFKMQFDGATDSWGLVGFDNNYGIGEFAENVRFTFPPGQNGANSGSHLQSTGTLPTWSEEASYSIDRNGHVKYSLSCSVATVDGSGADLIFSVTPLKNNIDIFGGIGFYKITSLLAANTVIALQNSGNYLSELYVQGSSSSLSCNTFTATDVTTQFSFSMYYQLYVP